MAIQHAHSDRGLTVLGNTSASGPPVTTVLKPAPAAELRRRRADHLGPGRDLPPDEQRQRTNARRGGRGASPSPDLVTWSPHVNIADHFAWHRDRIPSAPPRIHTRGVYVDERGHGSELGSPAFAPEFRRYLENPFAQRIERYEGESCSHPTFSQMRVEQLRSSGQLPARDECPSCEGSRRSGERHQFEWALRAAMERIERMAPWHQN